jgi:REP element-mobilizing transposase RayT
MARNTIGFHLVKGNYGMWLPGDSRGSWSEAWDDQIGFTQPHNLNPGDPVRERMAFERMTHPTVFLDDEMSLAVANALGDCVKKGLEIAACAIDSTHTHLVLPYSPRDIDITAKWIADQTTKRVHRDCAHQGPLWAKGKWCGFIFDDAQWNATVGYVERHNLRRGLTARPFDWLT